MSDPRRKPGGDSSATWTGKSGGKPGKLREKLDRILNLTKEIGGNQEEIEEYDKILEERDLLKKKVEDMESENEKLKTDKQVLWQEFGSKMAELTKKVDEEGKLRDENAKLEDEKRTLQTNAVAATRELKKLKNEADKNRSSLKKQEDQLAARNHQITMLGHQLAAANSSVTEAHRRLGGDRLTEIAELGSMGPEFEKLADRCHALAVKYFKEVEVSGTIIAPEVLSQLMGINAQSLPLSSARTPANKLARCAVAEGVIAKVIADEIFVDLYFSSVPDNSQTRIPSGLGSGVSTVLEFLQGAEVHQQNIVRCQLLAAYEDLVIDKGLSSQNVLDRAVKLCYRHLSSLLGNPDRDAGFNGELRALLRDAMNLWLPLQRNEERVVSDTELDDQWASNKDFNNVPHADIAGKDLTGKPVKPILALFPQVSVEDEVIFSGVALFSNQPTVIVSQIEAERAEAERKRPPITSSTTGSLRGSRGRSNSLAPLPRSPTSTISSHLISPTSSFTAPANNTAGAGPPPSSPRDGHNQANGFGSKIPVTKGSPKVGSRGGG